jgi:hypothetical protein
MALTTCIVRSVQESSGGSRIGQTPFKSNPGGTADPLASLQAPGLWTLVGRPAC